MSGLIEKKQKNGEMLATSSLKYNFYRDILLHRSALNTLPIDGIVVKDIFPRMLQELPKMGPIFIGAILRGTCGNPENLLRCTETDLTNFRLGPIRVGMIHGLISYVNEQDQKMDTRSMDLFKLIQIIDSMPHLPFNEDEIPTEFQLRFDLRFWPLPGDWGTISPTEFTPKTRWLNSYYEAPKESQLELRYN